MLNRSPAQVKRFTLVSPTGAPLPGFSGGSHIYPSKMQGWRAALEAMPIR